MVGNKRSFHIGQKRAAQLRKQLGFITMQELLWGGGGRGCGFSVSKSRIFLNLTQQTSNVVLVTCVLCVRACVCVCSVWVGGTRSEAWLQ